MQDVEPLGLFAAEHVGHDWIDEGFDRSVAQCQHDAPPVQKRMAFLLSSGYFRPLNPLNGRIGEAS